MPPTDVDSGGSGGPTVWLWLLLAAIVLAAAGIWAMRGLLFAGAAGPAAESGPVAAAPSAAAPPVSAPSAAAPAAGAIAWTDLSAADRAAFEQAARDLGLGGPA